ncbi:ATP-binding protein [Actinomyces faecalis]|uniref:ATP-binding protein n=1 Tax=Actinomyces faecalis TaxID=2722820 RepID=UPI00155758AA|nr:ATP-binding protein [Actinomyces faecalis]
MIVSNPFSPTLGKTPPLLVGREDVLEEFDDALASGPGAHERVTVLTGMRGIGKTVMLNELERLARERYGWIVFSETGTIGFMDRLRDAVVRELLRQDPGARTRLTDLGLFGVSIGVSHEAPTLPPVDLRGALSGLLDQLIDKAGVLGQQAAGVMITLDELHHLRTDEIRQLAATIQHLIREDRQICLVMAGIPAAVRPLLASSDDSNPITFLRRANMVTLGGVRDADVERALQEPVEDVEARWDPDALAAAVRACAGYPFMIQLVGRWACRYAQGVLITPKAAAQGIAKARRKIGALVHEPAVSDLSDVDRTFLVAMAVDDGPSLMADIAERMGVDAQYAGVYRKRLIDAQMIESVGWGQVDFILPYVREYLREHVAPLISEGGGM